MGTWRTLDVSGTDEPARHAVVHEALDAGCTVMDTSPMYGHAERVLADSLGDRRDEAFVATKVWTPDPHEGRRQIDRALDLVSKATEGAPQNFTIRLDYARVLGRAGKKAEAAKVLEQLSSLAPKTAPVQAEIAKLTKELQ